MSPIPAWVPATIAISLLVIAVSFLVMGGVALAVGIGLKRQTRAARAQLAAFTADARAATARLKTELEGFADLSAEARIKLKGAITSVDGRLKDLDALVEVLQEEAEETALDVAAFVRTLRRSSAILGAARAITSRRRRARG
jgi:hypothetical protein